MIVLHRRGTTGEWHQADMVADQLPNVLLKDGEFAIEEREDGSRHVKIGDGHTKFSALPYIDERAEKAVKAELLKTEDAFNDKMLRLATSQDTLFNKVTSSTSDLHKKIATTADDLNDKLDASISVLDKKLSKTIDDYTTNVTLAIGKVDKDVGAVNVVVNNEVKPNIASLDRKLVNMQTQHTKDVTNLLDKIDTAATTIKADLSTHKAESDATLSSKVSELNSAFTTSVSTVKKDLEAMVNRTNSDQVARLLAVKTALETALSLSEQKQLEDLTEIKQSLEAADNEQLLAFTSHVQQYNAAVLDILKQLTELKKDVKQLNTKDATIVDSVYSVVNNLASISTKLSEEISTLAEKQEGDIEQVSQSLASHGASIEALESGSAEIIAMMLDHVAKIYIELAAMSDDDLLILEKAFSVESSLNNKIANINKVIDKIIADIEDLAPGGLASTEARLIARMDAGDAALQASIEETTDNITIALNETDFRISTNLDSAVQHLTALIDEQNTAINTSITDNVSTLNSKLDTTKADIEANIANVKSEINNTINTTQESLNSQITTAETTLTNRLDQLETTTLKTVESELRGVIDSSEQTLTKKITETNDTLAAAIQETKQSFTVALTTTEQALTVAINDTNTAVNENISAINAEISKNTDAITEVSSALSATDATFTSKIAEIKTDLNTAKNELTAEVANINSKITACDVSDPEPDSAETVSTSFISSISQEDGKISATKAYLPLASKDVAGITKIGVPGGSASYEQAVTNAEELLAIKTAIAGGVHFVGIVVAPEDLTTSNTADTVTLSTNKAYTAQSGDIVIQNGKEFIWADSAWHEFGDVSIVNDRINGLSVTDTPIPNKFITAVSQTAGKIAVERSRPTAADISFGTGDLLTELTARKTSFDAFASKSVLFNESTASLYVGIENADNTIFFCCGTAEEHIDAN